MPDTIKAYLDRGCLDHEGGSALLAQMSLADAKKVKLPTNRHVAVARADT